MLPASPNRAALGVLEEQQEQVEDAFSSRKSKAVLGIGEKYTYRSCSRGLELLHVGIWERKRTGQVLPIGFRARWVREQ